MLLDVEFQVNFIFFHHFKNVILLSSVFHSFRQEMYSNFYPYSSVYSVLCVLLVAFRFFSLLVIFIILYLSCLGLLRILDVLDYSFH